MRLSAAVFLVSLCAIASAEEKASSTPRIVEVQKVWDQAPHNAFTDLVRFKDRWICVFREGKAHVSPDGALRVISSTDGKSWKSEALIESDETDLRDAKITVTPNGRLMLAGAGAYPKGGPIKHQSFVWFSDNGSDWSDAVKVGDPDVWLWRITWHKGKAYGVGYSTTDERFTRLYQSDDGEHYKTIVDRLGVDGYSNEAGLTFLEDDTFVCVLRRDPDTGMLGISKPPYTDWKWTSLETRVGGPQVIQLPDGRFVVASRLYNPPRTSLSWLDISKSTLTEFLKFPSGGDTSYPGMVWHDGLLWVSYYSSHEGKTSIYLAKVAFD